MRKAKLIFSVIMAAVMICVSVVPAFAMTDYDITTAMDELTYYADECLYLYAYGYQPTHTRIPTWSEESNNRIVNAVSKVNSEIYDYETEEDFNRGRAALDDAVGQLCISSSELKWMLDYLEKDYNSAEYYNEETMAKIKSVYEEALAAYESGTEREIHVAYVNMRNLLDNLCVYNEVAGDVNGDGELNIVDVALMQLDLAQLNKEDFTSSQNFVADMNRDAKINTVANWQLEIAKLNNPSKKSKTDMVNDNMATLKENKGIDVDTKQWAEIEQHNYMYNYDRYDSESKTEFSSGTVNLMENITQSEPEGISDSYDYEKFNSFAIDLIKYNINNNENIVASPASAIYALGMAANGANGKTNEEMLSLFNVNSNEELNKCLYQFMVKNCGENSGVNIANSMWINKDTAFEANEEFLQTNADYYNSDVFSAAFDGNTVNDINKWVSGNTDGRIPKIVENLDNNTVMLLINTVLFDADWYTPFDANDSSDGEFTNADGTKSIVKMMSSDYERYIEDDDTTGFIKAYDNGYKFVALLPEEGVSIEEYLNALTPEKLSNLFSQSNSEIAEVTLPAFKTNNEIKLRESLEKMGMKDAFDSVNADFTRMGTSTEGNLYISGIKQKAEIAVDEMGTKGSAATVIEFGEGSAPPSFKKRVDCDRPFLYFIIDSETKMPLFAGAYVNGEK